MKKIFNILLLILISSAIQAQQVKPDIINTIGFSAQYSGGYLAYSVGEPVIGTSSGTSATLTQGFLQTWQAIVSDRIVLKFFLEGLYAGGGMMNQAQGVSGPEFGAGIADKATIELHDQTTPYNTVYEFINTDLQTDGDLEISNLPVGLTGSYYLVIKHRNSIETWSALPYDFSSAGPFSYDFSTAASQAYGNNQKMMGTVYAIWGGDVTQDGIVDGSDMTLIDNASKPPALQGYYPEDTNGDGIVDGSDMTMIDNNSKPPSVQVMKP